MAGAYSEAELEALERAGERRTAVARMDIRQLHLTEFVQGGDLSASQSRADP